MDNFKEKLTPTGGTWTMVPVEVDYHGDGVLIPARYQIISEGGPGGDYRIAETTDGFRQAGENALIMAAAPDLYAALSVIVEDPTLREWLLEHDPTSLRQAQAAIEKADTGEEEV